MPAQRQRDRETKNAPLPDLFAMAKTGPQANEKELLRERAQLRELIYDVMTFGFSKPLDDDKTAHREWVIDKLIGSEAACEFVAHVMEISAPANHSTANGHQDGFVFQH
jgi:hypothetical protein